MLLGIISDTHNRLERTTQALDLFEKAGVEAVIHCGDICDRHILSLFPGKPTWYVQGNNDDDHELRQHAVGDLHYLGQGDIVTLADKRIAVTHGHLYRLTDTLLQQAPDFLLTGHTHVAHHQMHQGIICINPGALHRASEYSVALVNLATAELQFVPVNR
jgi:putative phosphoesterase